MTGAQNIDFAHKFSKKKGEEVLATNFAFLVELSKR